MQMLDRCLEVSGVILKNTYMKFTGTKYWLKQGLGLVSVPHTYV